MTPTDILTPALAGLAFYGYVQCLTRYMWPTLLITAALVVLVLRIHPFAAEDALNWIGAAVLIGVAVITARLWPLPKTAPKPRRKPKRGQKEIVIDGTNVMYWEDNTPALATLRSTVAYLLERDYLPFVFLDASTRHHLRDKTLDAAGFAHAMGLHPTRVVVCPAETEADVFILKFARKNGLSIVSNDRFGDRKQMVRGIKLVKGVFAKGKPILDGL